MIVMSLMTMHRMVSARGAGHNVVAQPSLLHFAQLFQFALLSHAHQIDNDDPDSRIDYDTSYLRPSSSQSELILVQRHKLTMGKENDISAHFSRFPREARVTTMRASQRNKTADQPLGVCRMTGPMGAWSMQLSGCFNPDGLTSSPSLLLHLQSMVRPGSLLSMAARRTPMTSAVASFVKVSATISLVGQ